LCSGWAASAILWGASRLVARHHGGVALSLDREACRADPAMIDHWERSLDAEYRALLARVDVTTPSGAEEVRNFEHACTADREWAAGYRAGRADGERLDRGQPLEGPGVSSFGDGWSPSVTRQAGYDLALQDSRR
jgi:hypothetical protein